MPFEDLGLIPSHWWGAQSLPRHTGCFTFPRVLPSDRKHISKALNGLIPAPLTRRGFKRNATYPCPICGQWNSAQQHLFPWKFFPFALEQSFGNAISQTSLWTLYPPQVSESKLPFSHLKEKWEFLTDFKIPIFLMIFLEIMQLCKLYSIIRYYVSSYQCIIRKNQAVLSNVEFSTPVQTLSVWTRP